MATMHPSESIAQRLALLLTGDWAQADAIMHDVLVSQPELKHVEVPLVRRLVILRARERAGLRTKTGKPWLVRAREAHRAKRGDIAIVEVEPVAEVLMGMALVAHRAASMLERQQFEAWLLHRVEDLELRQVARAMDCSTTAAGRHLEVAEGSLGKTLGGEYVESIDQLRRQASEAPTLPTLAVARERSARRRAGRLWVIRVAAGIALIAVVVLILSMF